MTHLDDGALQAFLDDELPSVERARVAEHLLGCEACRGRYEALAQANALFTRAVSLLDVEPPAARSTGLPKPGARARAGTSSFVKAALLVLAVAAAASAAVPGSPVRDWVVQVIEPAPGPAPALAPAPAPVAVADPAPAEVVPPAPAGISIESAAGGVLVTISGMDGGRIRLGEAEGTRASVSVSGAARDPAFRTGPGRLDVQGGEGGVVEVRLPVSGVGARLEVEGRLYAESEGGRLRIRVPADTVAGEFIW